MTLEEHVAFRALALGHPNMEVLIRDSDCSCSFGGLHRDSSNIAGSLGAHLRVLSVAPPGAAMPRWILSFVLAQDLRLTLFTPGRDRVESLAS